MGCTLTPLCYRGRHSNVERKNWTTDFRQLAGDTLTSGSVLDPVLGMKREKEERKKKEERRKMMMKMMMMMMIMMMMMTMMIRNAM